MGQGLQDDDAAALAHDEAVAVPVEGPARLLGLVVAGGERPHGVESGDATGGDRRLDAAGDHGIGVAVLDEAEGVADGARAGGAGRDGAADRSLGPESDGDMSRGEIGQDGRDGERGHLPGAALPRIASFSFSMVVSPPMPEPMITPVALGVALVDGEPRVGHGHLGGGQGIDDELIEPSQFLLVHVCERIEALQLPGDLRAVAHGSRTS